MNYYSLSFAGQTIELHGNKMLWFPSLKLLCASDIHFEKGSFFRKFGSLIPPYDTQETLNALEEAMAQFQPEIFIALGDSFHDVHAAQRLSEQSRQRLMKIIDSTQRWIWITGNHDPAIASAIAGERHEEIRLGGIWFRHETTGDKAVPEISGHYHPKSKVVVAGSPITSACFMRVKENIMLPAYGHFTGGLSVDDPVLAKLFPREERQIFLVYEKHVYAFDPA